MMATANSKRMSCGPLVRRMPWEEKTSSSPSSRTRKSACGKENSAVTKPQPTTTPTTTTTTTTAPTKTAAPPRVANSPPPEKEDVVEQEERVLPAQRSALVGEDVAAEDAVVGAGRPMLVPEHEEEEVSLVKCEVCDRSFAADRIEKHRKICGKAATSASKRKTYDAVSKLLPEAVQAVANKLKIASPQPPPKPKKAAPPKARRENQSSGFAAAAAAAPDPSLVECPHCHRRFNETAAERHIPVCEKLNKRMKPAGGKPVPSAAPGGLSAKATAPAALGSGKAASSPKARLRPGQSDPSDRKPCPHCGRQFEKGAFLRHVDICKGVQNKPGVGTVAPNTRMKR